MSSDYKPVSTRMLVASSVVFYAMMTGAGLWLMGLQDELDIRRVIFGNGDEMTRDTLLGAGAGLVVVIGTWLMRGVGPVKRHIRRLREMLGEPGVVAIAVVAVASSVGEEVFFRGALQPLIGFWWTVILFGLLHGGSRKDLRFAVLFATAAGVLLGWLAEHTGNLLAPMLCHVTINFFNLHLLADAAPEDEA